MQNSKQPVSKQNYQSYMGHTLQFDNSVENKNAIDHLFIGMRKESHGQIL